ncbi:MAG: hypothetical protein HYY01_09475 [Chloroflexi bacterium]|nr:hypothetical protein [Chloroflexota bacterium]
MVNNTMARPTGKKRRKASGRHRVSNLLVNAGLVLLLVVLVLALGGALARIFGLWGGGGLGAPGSVHTHQDLKVYLLGKPVDFSQPKYQLRSDYIHMEAGNGDMIHTHATGATLGLFFESMGITFNDQCFILEIGERYCNDGQNTLKMLVNGTQSARFHQHETRQGDRILVSYGPETPDQLDSQLATVTNFAAGPGQ